MAEYATNTVTEAQLIKSYRDWYCQADLLGICTNSLIARGTQLKKY